MVLEDKMATRGCSRKLSITAAIFALTAGQAWGGLVATYNMQGNTNASQGGVAALTIDLDDMAARSAFGVV